MSEAKKGKPRPDLRRRIVKTCPRCGERFETGGRAGKRTQVFCSLRCAKMTRNGRQRHTAGYVNLYNPTQPQNRILEHRMIAAKALGRPLKRTEIVHHINMDKADNRNCNLLVCSQAYMLWLEHEMAQRYAQEHFIGG